MAAVDPNPGLVAAGLLPDDDAAYGDRDAYAYSEEAYRWARCGRGVRVLMALYRGVINAPPLPRPASATASGIEMLVGGGARARGPVSARG